MTNREEIRKLLNGAQANLTEALEALNEGDAFGTGLRIARAEIELTKLRAFKHVTNDVLDEEA